MTLLEIRDSLIQIRESWDRVYYRFGDPEYAHMGFLTSRLLEEIKKWEQRERESTTGTSCPI